MNYTLPMIKYTIILQGNIIFVHINKGRSNVYTRSFGNTVIDVNGTLFHFV